MASKREIEVKFRVDDLRTLTRKLRQAGFRLDTRRTHEMNTLYDLPGQVLRKRKQLLRLREYGGKWTLTHKSGKKTGRHSSREELETVVEDGEHMELILRRWDMRRRFATRNFAPSGPMARGRLLWTRLRLGIFARSRARRGGLMPRRRS
jgi:adenylate cyclase class 2